ncbi:MAG: lysophospholipid acyltransferase family protein [Spirochaetales bacterium]|nr:lysophospholipid acyltransferase family protein [Spirochaetales bacterium]
MKLFYRLVNGLIKGLLIAACRIDKKDLEKVPAKGPFILVTNHINFLEAPFLYIFLRPRRTIALGKSELWDKAFTRFLMNLWEVLPIKRGAVDIQAMKNCIKVLEDGDFLCLAPEGTRSRNGKLLKGKAGVIMFAQKGNAPIIPMGHWGGENLASNLKKFKRTPITIKVGEPVNITIPEGVKSDSKVRQQIADEVMIQIARLMPEEYHGVYTGQTDEEPRFLTKA